MLSFHNEHTTYIEERAPEVDRLEVTRVSFRRGAGCCAKSPMRIVTAYYDANGQLLFEVDPSVDSH